MEIDVIPLKLSFGEIEEQNTVYRSVSGVNLVVWKISCKTNILPSLLNPFRSILGKSVRKHFKLVMNSSAGYLFRVFWDHAYKSKPRKKLY